MDALELSIVIPVFNEVENLEPLVCKTEKAIAPLQKSWELIFVDDGSSDGSFEEIVRLKARFPFIRGIKFDRNHGQTAAMDAGIRASRGSTIITMDADLQNDPSDIPLLLEAMSRADAAVGWRFVRNDNLIRRLSSRFANWVRNLISEEEIHDIGCSLKAFKAETAKKLKLFEGMHRFLPTLVKLDGGKVEEVKVSHHPRTRGTSKYNIWNRIFRSFLDLLAIRWMKWRNLRYKIVHEI